MYANSLITKDGKAYWVCPFCSTRNPLGETTTMTSDGQTSTTPPLLPISPVCEYRQALQATDDVLPKDQISIMLVLDANLPKDEVIAIGKMIEDLVIEKSKSTLPMTWKIGLMVFDAQVSLYQLGTSSGLASCHVFHDNNDVIDDASFYLLTKASVEPLWTALGARFGFSSSGAKTSSEPVKSRLEILKERKEARLRNPHGGMNNSSSNGGAAMTASPWVNAPSSSQPPKPRATGLAVQCALDLAVSGSRIWLFTNGCPSFGDGSVVEGNQIADYKLARAVSFFRIVGRSADSVAVDVFCSGALELALPAYQALVEGSGGYAISHDTFSGPHLTKNASFILDQTKLSLGLFREEETENIENPESWLEGCTVDIRLCR
jgi:hypothetical protein